MRHLLIILILFLTTGCYATIIGKVIDAETGEPIEGAVILVEWTKTRGLGLTYTESYKVIEAITDKDGKVTVSGVSSPFVNPPSITVYKKGYVAWNNKFIFPDYKKREDFNYKDGITIKLELFEKEYSRSDHVFFLHSIIHRGKLIDEAYRWEELEKEGQK